MHGKNKVLQGNVFCSNANSSRNNNVNEAKENLLNLFALLIGKKTKEPGQCPLNLDNRQPSCSPFP
jgi:hypothetical protein